MKKVLTGGFYRCDDLKCRSLGDDCPEFGTLAEKERHMAAHQGRVVLDDDD